MSTASSLVPPPTGCPVCKLVEVLEYARVELDRLAGVHSHPGLPEEHRPRGIIINMLKMALDHHRGHTHHLKYVSKKKAPEG